MRQTVIRHKTLDAMKMSAYLYRQSSVHCSSSLLVQLVECAEEATMHLRFLTKTGAHHFWTINNQWFEQFEHSLLKWVSQYFPLNKSVIGLKAESLLKQKANDVSGSHRMKGKTRPTMWVGDHAGYKLGRSSSDHKVEEVHLASVLFLASHSEMINWGNG